MVNLSYDFVEAKNEVELRKKLIKLQAATGYTPKIINIYKNGKKVVAWYYNDIHMRRSSGK